ncbi:hypothetical protein LXL04_016240 [Taraxacum kok-saghyz]
MELAAVWGKIARWWELPMPEIMSMDSRITWADIMKMEVEVRKNFDAVVNVVMWVLSSTPTSTFLLRQHSDEKVPPPPAVQREGSSSASTPTRRFLLRQQSDEKLRPQFGQEGTILWSPKSVDLLAFHLRFLVTVAVERPPPLCTTCGEFPYSNLYENRARTARRALEFGRIYVVKPKGKHQATIVWLHRLGDNGPVETV